MSDSNSQSDAIIHIDGLKFGWPNSDTTVLDIEHLHQKRGEKIFLRGPSGSGKTTLLSLIAAVMMPQAGNVCINGINTSKLKNSQRDTFRSDNIGFIFQQFNLLPFLSVIDNVSLPCRFSKTRLQRSKDRGGSVAEECQRLLEAMQLPLDFESKSSVNELSVGQQQRVAAARALIGRPPLIIADEPTSALDSNTRSAFIQLLFSEVESAGSSLLFVSHDDSLASLFDRRIELAEINKSDVMLSLQSEFTC